MNQSNVAGLPAYYQLSRPELTQQIQAAGLRILEVGCAAGAMGAALLAKGAREVVGLDIFEPALAVARTRLSAAHRVDLDALPELPYPDGHFDLVTFADVLEHLRDPAQVLRHLERWIAPGGGILVSLPNVRHESVVLPLLVEGRWDYADSGILDRTHLRFFTRRGMEQLLQCAGYEIAGQVTGSQTTMPAYVFKAAELVEALGGDGKKFLQECNVVQFFAFAAPVARAEKRARSAAGGGCQGHQPCSTPRPDPWAGSRAQRVLLVPEIGAPEERWEEVLPRLAAQLSGDTSVTLGVVLPVDLHREHPAALKALPTSLDLDLMLAELPRTAEEWEALVRGTTILVLTSPQPELAALARRLGVNVHDALRDPALANQAPRAAEAQPEAPRA